LEGVLNFEEVLSEADGCIIARAYIAIQSPVEDVVKQQYDMIHTCRKQLKPAIIST
jgi:pyruvate kinase